MLVDSKAESSTKNKEMVLKAEEYEEDEDDISLMARRFEKYLRTKSKGKFAKGRNSFGQFRKTSSNVGCFKCVEVGHRIKECPTWKNPKGNPGVQAEKKVFKRAICWLQFGEIQNQRMRKMKKKQISVLLLSHAQSSLRSVRKKKRFSVSWLVEALQMTTRYVLMI